MSGFDDRAALREQLREALCGGGKEQCTVHETHDAALDRLVPLVEGLLRHAFDDGVDHAVDEHDYEPEHAPVPDGNETATLTPYVAMIHLAAHSSSGAVEVLEEADAALHSHFGDHTVHVVHESLCLPIYR